MYKYCRYVNLQKHCLICNIIRLAFQREHPKSLKTAEFARVRRNVESVSEDPLGTGTGLLKDSVMVRSSSR